MTPSERCSSERTLTETTQQAVLKWLEYVERINKENQFVRCTVCRGNKGEWERWKDRVKKALGYRGLNIQESDTRSLDGKK